MKPITLVRSLYGDLSEDENGNYLFSDETVEGWLELTGNNPYAAAANACRALAVDQAYLLKVVRTDDLQVNGAVVAAELRLTAENLDAQAIAFEQSRDDAFEVVEWLL